MATGFKEIFGAITPTEINRMFQELFNHVQSLFNNKADKTDVDDMGDYIDEQLQELAGEGRTTETIKNNSDRITHLENMKIYVGTEEPENGLFWLDTN